MTDINKQKFLAELSKLLTFMYEEDRQDAIAMYAMMFDEADDERRLLQYLVSPTRQAVIIARAYNAKERKLQVSTQSKADVPAASEEVPEFMHAIFQIRDEVMGDGEDGPKVSENQISLFEEPEQTEEEPAEQPADEPAEQPKAVSEPEAEPEAPEAEEKQDKPESADARPDEEQPQQEDTQPKDEVDAFLEDYTPTDEIAEPESEENAEEKPKTDIKPDSQAPADVEEEKSSSEIKLKRKARVPLLILYIIAAVPLGLAAVIILLLAALVLLAVTALAISVGILAITSAISGFAVFADILVVLGIAFVVLALGLLLLWTFIWMLGGAIPGTVRGIIALGRRWCYKEVRAE